MLPKLKVAAPCPADWNKMTGDDRVRFCSLCNLNVYNFSAMTEPEVLNILQSREGRLCARLYRRADGTILTQDCPVGLRAQFRRLTRWATAVLAMIFAAPLARAQKLELQPPQPIVQIEAAKDQIQIHVINQLGDDVRGAIVELQDKAYNVLARVETDRHGRARLAQPEDGTYILVVRAPLLLTYSRVLAFNSVTSQVTVSGDYGVVMGEIMPIEMNSWSALSAMPMRGMPDSPKRGANSVR